ncbi:hypothetical protein BH11CYA1_BH11CYA1_09980 [soil metagenome]
MTRYEHFEQPRTDVPAYTFDVNMANSLDGQISASAGAAGRAKSEHLPKVEIGEKSEKTQKIEKTDKSEKTTGAQSDWIKRVTETADGKTRTVTFDDGTVSTYSDGVLTERTKANGGKDVYKYAGGVLVEMDHADGKVLKLEGNSYALYDSNGKSLGKSEFTVLTADGKGYTVKNRPVRANELGDPSQGRTAELTEGSDEVISVSTAEPSREKSFELFKALTAKDETAAQALLADFKNQNMSDEDIAGAYQSYIGHSLKKDMGNINGDFVKATPEIEAESQNRLKRVFTQVDTDGNGVLSDAETIAAMSNDNFKGDDAKIVAGLRTSFNKNTGLLTTAPISIDGVDDFRKGQTAEAMLAGFDIIDTNHDGKLQQNEIIDSASSQDLALGRDFISVLNTESNKSLTRNDLEVLAAKGKNPVADTNISVSGQPEQSLYGNFSPKEAIRSENFGQGGVGDCHIMSSLTSMAATEEGRKTIEKMIVDNDNGTYTVTFPGAPNEKLIVKKPTEAEQLIYARNSVAGTGYWATVIESAYGQYVNKSVSRRNISNLTGSDQPNEAAGQGAISILGGNAEALNLLTGKNSYSKSISGLTDEQLENKMMQSKINQTPIIVGKNGVISEIVYGGDANVAPPGKHFYGVVDYDPATKMVTMRNPWNKQDKKYAGKFQVTLQEFRAQFSDIAGNDVAQ